MVWIGLIFLLFLFCGLVEASFIEVICILLLLLVVTLPKKKVDWGDLAKNVVIIECIEVAAAWTFGFHGLKTQGFSFRHFSYLPIFLVHLDAFLISGPVELQIAASEPMGCLLVYLVFYGGSDRPGIQLHCAQSQSPGCREKDFDG